MDESNNWGKNAVIGLAVWAGLGGVLVLSNQHSLPVSARFALAWPVFLFVAPPGWGLLIWLWGQGAAKAEAPRPMIPKLDADRQTSSVTATPTAPTPGDATGTGAGTGTRGAAGPANEIGPGTSSNPLFHQGARALAARHGWICQICLEQIPDLGWGYEGPDPRRLSIDQIIPTSAGGSDNISNLRPVHASCSSAPISRPPTAEVYRPERITVAPQPPPPIPVSRPAAFTTFRTPAPEPRRGEWRASKTVVQALRRELKTADLSDEQYSRAIDFLYADHPYELLEYCQRDHEFTLENSYFFLDENGRVGRQCRACRRAARNAHRFRW